jgi:hypothetical protein
MRQHQRQLPEALRRFLRRPDITVLAQSWNSSDSVMMANMGMSGACRAPVSYACRYHLVMVQQGCTCFDFAAQYSCSQQTATIAFACLLAHQTCQQPQGHADCLLSMSSAWLHVLQVRRSSQGCWIYSPCQRPWGTAR